MANHSYGKSINRIRRNVGPSSYTALTVTNQNTYKMANSYSASTKDIISNFIKQNKWKFHPPPRPDIRPHH